MSSLWFVRRTRETVVVAVAAVAALGGVSSTGLTPVKAAMPTGTGVAPTAVVSRTVDCTTPVTISRVYVWVELSDTVEVTFSNCTYGWQVRDSSGSVLRSGTDTSGIQTLQPLQYIRFANSSGGNLLRVYANPVYPETVPSGTRQLVADITIPVDALQMNIGPETPTGDLFHNLGGLATCKLALDTYGGAVYYNHHVYAVLPITVTKAGTYTFRGVSTTPVSSYLDSSAPYNPIRDPFLALYRGFDPSQPDAGIVGCNDDLNDLYGYADTLMGERLPDGSIMDGHQPYFVAQLQPGDYELVLTTFSPISSLDWVGQNFGPVSTKFEMWGPSDSLCERGDSACVGDDGTPSFDFNFDRNRLLGRNADGSALPKTL